jgi:hypothetical protein
MLDQETKAIHRTVNSKFEYVAVLVCMRLQQVSISSSKDGHTKLMFHKSGKGINY